MLLQSEPLCSVKDLARLLGRGKTYVWAMVRCGFIMSGKRATLTEARQWLREHPEFTERDAYPRKTEGAK